ncbi:MAG: hypothetical protein D6706_18055 [Chloroflexi bacterium]|nr:MAG: hypothetical protein D6706_18055 [Chloroflexota bacterium]
MLAQLVNTYPEYVQLVYRHFPLNRIHSNAQKAAEAAEAAGAQGAFWAYHDALFATQAIWAEQPPATAREHFIQLAAELNLDLEQFTADLDNSFYAPRVAEQEAQAKALGLPGTPAVILDGDLLTGQELTRSYFIWDAYVQLRLLEDRQYTAPPPMQIDLTTTYLAHVEMASGEQFVIELFPQFAPQTVNSFIFLTKAGWYDGVSFHRVIPNFIAQTGDPTGTGFGGPGYTLPDEINPALSHDRAGVVATANTGPNTNGSQWYITLASVPQLDGKDTIFGQVITGLDVVQKLTPRTPDDPNAPPGDTIARIWIEEK